MSTTRARCFSCGAELPERSAATRCAVCQEALREAFKLRPPLAPGTVLADGAFRLVSPVGFGSSGIVYAADEVGMDTRVAIKEVFPLGCQRQRDSIVAPDRKTRGLLNELKKHVQDEAALLSQLHHSKIVRVHGLFEHHDTVYIIMELVRGKDMLGLFRTHGTPLSAEEVLDFAEQAGMALDALHRKGWMHGDVKPENFFRTNDGRIVLLDFGTATSFAWGGGRTKELTAGYAPPEQHTTAYGKEGPWTDVYSLSASLYQLLSGDVPPAAPQRVEGQHLPPLTQLRPDVDSRVTRAIEQGLTLDPRERPQTIETLMAVLLPELDPERIQAGPVKRLRQLQVHKAGVMSTRAFHASADGGMVALGNEAGVLVVLEGDNLKRINVGTKISSLALTASGDRLITGGSDGSVKVFDKQGQLLTTLLKSETPVGAVGIAADGSYLAAGLFDGTTLVWNADGESMTTLAKHEAPVRAVAISSSGLVATGSHDCVAKLWELPSGKLRLTLAGHSSTVYALAFSSDGKLLASGSQDKSVKIWLTHSGRETRSLGGHEDIVRGVAFSPDGKRVLSGASDGQILIHDVTVGWKLGWAKPNKLPVRGLVWPATGPPATASDDGTVWVWDDAQD